MKKLHLPLILLLIAVCAQIASSQKPKPKSKNTKPKTPPKMVVATTEVNELGWKKYVLEGGKFSLFMPSKPDRKVDSFKEGGVSRPIVLYTSVDEGKAFLFGFLDFKMPINDEATLRATYDGWREGLTGGAMTGGELIEKDFIYEGKLGREILYKTDLSRIDGKSFFVKGTFFQLVVFNFIDTGNDSQEKYAEQIGAFNDSFKFEKITPNTTNSKQSSRIENGVYYNEFFKFSLDLPENWVTASQEDTELIRQASKARSNKYNSKTKASLQDSMKRTHFLFTASKLPLGAEDNAFLMGAAELDPSSKASLLMIGLASQNNFKTNLGYTILKGVTPLNINKTQFVVIEMQKINEFGMTIKQKLFMTRSRGYLLEFILTYFDDGDLPLFDESLKTFKFESSRK